MFFTPLLRITGARVRKVDVLENENGQAIFELLVFMPILISFYLVIANVGDAINASINQNKVTRRYYYNLIKGNSYIPRSERLTAYKNGGSVQTAGMSAIGFAESLSGAGSGSPIAPCFRFNSMLTGDSSQECDEAVEERSTALIKVFTAYGICGETFELVNTPTGGQWQPAFSRGGGEPDHKSKFEACGLLSFSL